jgi:hypothetical protein
MGLHDVKRFSGELALRAGADVLLLQAHMDHANIKTTLNHYCRPKTRNLVDKIVVPIPNQKIKPSPPTPPEPEKLPEVRFAPAFHFNSKNEIVQFYLNETKRLEHSAIAARTSSGTILTILNPEEEIPNDNNNNNNNNNATSNGNNAG